MPQPKQGEQRLIEGLQWFPRESTFFGAFDFQSAGSLSIDSPFVVKLLEKLVPPADRGNFAADKFAGARIDRVSFAYVEQPQRPAESRIYIRLSGNFNRTRLTRTLLACLPEATSRESSTVGHENATYLTMAKQAPAFALVGDRDILIGGFEKNLGNEKRHQQVIDEMMELRLYSTGSVGPVVKPNLTVGSYEKDLRSLPDYAFAVIMGDLPASIYDSLSTSKGGPFRTPPRFVRVTGTHRPATRLSLQFRLPTAGDVPNFGDDLVALKNKCLNDAKTHPNEPHHTFRLALTERLVNNFEAIKGEASVRLGLDWSKGLQESLIELFEAVGPLSESGARPADPPPKPKNGT